MNVREEWRPVLGGDYEVSSLGRVRRMRPAASTSVQRLLRPSLKSTGYLGVRLYVNGHATDFAVHALVAEAFIGRRPRGLVVNHIDCDRTNNAHSNLEYVTHRQNILHAARLGRTAKGVRHGRHTMPGRTARGERVNTARLTAPMVSELRTSKALGESAEALSSRFGICVTQVYNIVARRAWRHVP